MREGPRNAKRLYAQPEALVTGWTTEHVHSSLEHLLKCQLAAESLRSCGSLRLRVTGHSMLPTIWPGDVLMIERRELGQIAPGDVVLYIRDGRLFAHRALRFTGTGEDLRLITRGDALPREDAPVSASEILGRVSVTIRVEQAIQLPDLLTTAGYCVAGLLRRSSHLSRLVVHLATKSRTATSAGLADNSV